MTSSPTPAAAVAGLYVEKGAPSIFMGTTPHYVRDEGCPGLTA